MTTVRLPLAVVSAIHQARIVPTIAVAAAAALILCTAYQLPVTHRIDVARDNPVLVGFYAREQTPQFAYRWTGRNSTIRLLSLPSGRYTLSLGVVAPRPTGTSDPVVDLALDGTVFQHVTVGSTYSHLAFTILIPVVRAGMHTLTLHSQVFTEPTRAGRALGIIVTDVSLRPVRWPLVPPPIPLLAFVGETLMLHRLLRTRWEWRPALLATMTSAAAVVLVIVMVPPVTGLVDFGFTPLALVFGIAVIPRFLADRRTMPTVILAAVALVVSSAIAAGNFLRTLNATHYPTDFGVFYRAATAVWTHHPEGLYDLPGIAANPLFGVVYHQPPFAAVLLSPLALQPFGTALFIWRVLLIGCIAGGIALLSADLRLHDIGTPRAWPLVILVTLTLLWLPLRQSLEGQWDGILFLLLVMTFIGLRRNRAPMVGISLAVAGLIKVYPLYLVLFLFWKREWRALSWLIAALSVLTAFSTLSVGWGTTALFYRHVLPQLGGSTTYPDNQSLVALLLRLFRIKAMYGPQVTLLIIASFLLITAPLCWRLRTKRSRTTSLRYALDFSLTVAAMLLAIPVTWPHYETALLLPVSVLFVAVASTAAPALGWRIWITSAIGVLTFGQDVILGTLLHLPLGRHSYVDRAIVVSLPIFAQLGLWIGIWFMERGHLEHEDHPAASSTVIGRDSGNASPIRLAKLGRACASVSLIGRRLLGRHGAPRLGQNRSNGRSSGGVP